MNKFIVFATFVVILAILPINLGCSGYDFDLRATSRRSASIEAELLDLIEQGFTVCNADSESGLSWAEINDCQVNDMWADFQKKLVPQQRFERFFFRKLGCPACP